jgi:hypothetical protein
MRELERLASLVDDMGVGFDHEFDATGTQRTPG